MEQGGVKSLWSLTAVLMLAACGSGAGAPSVSPPPVSPPPIPAYDARPVPRDQCGAEALQHLIGQPRTEIPVPVDVTSRRVACTTCPLTEDYSPSRLNILYDRDSGRVERVYCG